MGAALLKNWRSWILLALFVGPYLAFMGLGFLWLKERGWIWVCSAGLISIAMGVIFTLLMSRWSKSPKAFLPPIDWSVPQTFSEFDRKAWEIVERETDHGDALDMATLTTIDTYVATGKRLANRLAAHYHPLSHDPIERVPVIELLTALELAAEDLTGLCRQIPGGDLVTAADWKKAVVAANYIQKASDLYTYLLPIFNPVTGLSRLASQHLMVKPAWKNMQQNVLRWFHRAFVNRLGMHLIELYSGRLVIGSEQYRKLTRKLGKRAASVDLDVVELNVAFAGPRFAGKSRLLEVIGKSRSDGFQALRGRILTLGGDEEGLTRLKNARLVEVGSYTNHVGKESARDRSTRRHAVEEAGIADLLVFVIDARTGVLENDLTFLQSWTQWYADHPGFQIPPTLVVLTHADALADAASPHPNKSAHEAAIQSKIQGARGALPATLSKVVALDLSGEAAEGWAEILLPPLSTLCHLAERNALIRYHRNNSARSKAGRLFRQVGEQGRSLWQGIKERKGPRDAS